MAKAKSEGAPAEAMPIVGAPAGTVDDAVDALDMARELREGPEVEGWKVEEGGESIGSPQPRRGRPRGSRNRRSAGTREEVRARLKETKSELEAARRELEELREREAARSAAEAAEFEQMTGGLLELAIGSTCVTYFHRKAVAEGPHWELSEQEAALLTSAWVRAAKPYFDRYLGGSPFGAAIGVTVFVFASKKMQAPAKPTGEPVAVVSEEGAEAPADGA